MKLYCRNPRCGGERKTKGFRPLPVEHMCPKCQRRMGTFKPRTEKGGGAHAGPSSDHVAQPRRVSDRGATSRRRKRSGFTPASPAQRAKVTDLDYCIGCGKGASEYLAIDPAHLCSRAKGGCDEAACVVPLCRDQNGGCHRKFDDGDLDLLRIVAARWPAEREEVAHMLEHLDPVSVIEQLANTRTQWSDKEAA